MHAWCDSHIQIYSRIAARRLFGDISLQPLRTALVGSIIALILYFSNRLFLQKTKSLKALDLPVLASPGDQDIVQTLHEGHARYPNSPFALAVPGQQLVVLPVSEIDTVKALPETQLSIKKHHYNQFLGEYSHMGTKADEFDDAMRYLLVRNTPAVLASFVAEIDHAISSEFKIKPGTEWTTVTPRAIMPRVATILSGRAFVGLPLSRDEEWITANVNYTQDVSRAWVVLRFYPHFIRPLIAPFLKEVKALERSKALIGHKIANLLASQEASPADAESQNGPGGDMITWFKSRYANGTATSAALTRDQLLATFASIYNLSNALTYILFDLAAYPNAVTTLREELDAVLGPNGIAELNKTTLPKLTKLDSFLRESQRLSPTSLVNIPRIITDPNGLRLSTGQIIPPGYLAMIRAQPINQNAELYPDPTRFDPLRFARLREKPGHESRWQHTSTGSDNINFGHGLWACPGRFFASAQIKVVVAFLVREFEIRFPVGGERPVPLYKGLAIFPDAEARVEMRYRGGGRYGEEGV
ncbi:cytochrome P450 monooxygenase gliF [Aspergillus stella-maris]|uniref:cytochrome P450 monooxygenase gliF n=1 Tax=Aspergillus stella-maris TaxID=1810926 RepID=UPI003CCCCBC0